MSRLASQVSAEFDRLTSDTQNAPAPTGAFCFAIKSLRRYFDSEDFMKGVNAHMNIISRSQWGARPWRGSVYTTPLSSRTHFLVHYHGGPPRNDRGNANAKEIEGIHYANGWSGIGYNFIVGQDGAIREGRGWNLVGAHCPNYNTVGIGVYVAIGGDQSPSPEALAAVRWLYEEACRKTGKTLTRGWHGKYYATSCAGPKLIQWVKDGMKAGSYTAPTRAPSDDKATYYTPKGVSMSIKEIQEAVGVTPDGYYGNDTKVAVRTLQKRLGAGADGLWGPATEKAYKKGSPVKSRPTGKAPAFPLRSGYYFGPKSGPKSSVSGAYSNSNDLKIWQRQMKSRGWSIDVDGLYGPNTEKVAKQFQKEKGLPVDGLIGVSTWNAAWSAPVT